MVHRVLFPAVWKFLRKLFFFLTSVKSFTKCVLKESIKASLNLCVVRLKKSAKSDSLFHKITCNDKERANEMYWSNQQKRLTKWLGLCEKILGKILGKTDRIHYNIRGNPKQLIKKKKKISKINIKIYITENIGQSWSPTFISEYVALESAAGRIWTNATEQKCYFMIYKYLIIWPLLLRFIITCLIYGLGYMRATVYKYLR